MAIRVPTWMALFPTDSERVADAFSSLVKGLDLTQLKLANRLGKSPKTVNHWATGRTTTSLEVMADTVDAMDGLLVELHGRVDGMKAVLLLVDEAVESHRTLGTQKTKPSWAAYRRSSQRLDQALTQLEALMQEQK